MKIKLCRSKIHRAVVTGGDLNYGKGSITIGVDLMRVAHLVPYEMVFVNNIHNAAHWETYVIPGVGSEIVLNGAPARLFAPGDPVVIMAMIELDPHPENLRKFEHRIVYVLDDTNIKIEVTVERIDVDEWFV